MAIYRLSSQIISRSTGRTVTGAAAYRAGEKILDERMNQTWDFTKKKGIAHEEILAPDNAPEWSYDREKLWNEVEKSEKRKDAQLAREIQVALPIELTNDQKKNLITEFTKDSFVNKGMIADICLHDISGENPHAHIMLTMREIRPEGFGQKNRDWNKKEHLLEWREGWAKYANNHLALAGHEVVIDHRSYEKMGIPLEPQKKIGPLKHMSEDDRANTDRMQEYLETCRRNGEKIKANPEIATDLFSRKQAIFTENDILRLANTYSADKEQFDEVVSAIKNSPDLVLLGAGENGKERYTTRQTLEAENSMLSKSEQMAKAHSHKVKNKYQKQAKASRTLAPEQVKAFDHILSSGDMCCVVGYAGTGKSYMLDAVREAYEAGGYTVTGAALAGIAAQGLFESSGIPSQTIARRLLDQEQGRSELTKKHVLVIDEAGMVGTRQMNALISHAHEKGAKIILVGDGMQLQPIEAGGAFRGIYSRTEGVNLTEIRRQKEGWQKEATKYFEEGKSNAALDLYKAAGRIKEHQAQHNAIRNMINDWSEHIVKTGVVNSAMMMAYRNQDVDELNTLGRDAMRSLFFIKRRGDSFETIKGVKEFAEGDRILFLKNDRFMGVHNGNRGTVEKISGNDFLVRMDNNEQVAFDAAKYNHFNHGYAATVHKLQGATIKQSFVLADSYFDQHSALTAMSRHTDDARLYYSLERFQGGFQELKRVIGRKRPKELAIDFADKRGIDPSPRFESQRTKEIFRDAFSKAKENVFEFVSGIFKSRRETGLLNEAKAQTTKDFEKIADNFIVPEKTYANSNSEFHAEQKKLAVYESLEKSFKNSIPSMDNKNYIYETLRISKSTLSEAERTGFIRYTSEAIVFPGYDSQKKLKNASLYSLNSDNQMKSRDLEASDKKYPQILTGNEKIVWIVGSGFDALALHDIEKRSNKILSTVIVASGSEIAECLNNSEIREKIYSAEYIIIAKERSENIKNPSFTDRDYEIQAERIEKFAKKRVIVHDRINLVECNIAQLKSIAEKENVRATELLNKAKAQATKDFENQNSEFQAEQKRLESEKTKTQLVNEPHTQKTLDVYESQEKSFKNSIPSMDDKKPIIKQPDIQLPIGASNDALDCLNYIDETLRISQSTLSEAERTGFISYTSKGIVFAGYDSQGQLRNATLHSLNPTDQMKRRDIEGSDKTYPQILPGSPKSLWFVGSGFEALALHDMAQRNDKKPPTVIIASGSEISECLDNSEIRQKIYSAENIVIAKERSKYRKKQAFKNSDYKIQAELIEKFTEERVVFYTLPDKVKSLAVLNAAQFEYLKSCAEKEKEPIQESCLKEKEPVQEPCVKEKEKDNGFEMEM